MHCLQSRQSLGAMPSAMKRWIDDCNQSAARETWPCLIGLIMDVVDVVGEVALSRIVCSWRSGVAGGLLACAQAIRRARSGAWHGARGKTVI